MTATEPNFFLIGAARSGTNALTLALRAHPQAFVTQPKEPHFLAFAGERVRFSGPGDDTTINRVATTDLDRYLALYDDAGGAAVRGDASVSTLYYASRAIPTIDRHFPDARLIAILRDPVERAFSSFQYQRGYTREPCSDFERALELEDERVSAGWHHLWHYRRMGFYGAQLAPFVRHFGSDRVLILFYDDLVARPQSVLDAVARFLGIESIHALSVPRINVSGEPRNRIVRSASGLIESHPVLKLGARRLTSFRFRSWLRRASLRSAAVPPPAAARLRGAYADDLDLLRTMVPESARPAWLRARPGAAS